MLDVLFEQELVQNTGLGAEAIFETVAAYYKHENQTRGLPSGQSAQLSQGPAQGLCEKRCGLIAKSQSDCNREWNLCLKQRWLHARWRWILG